VHDIAPHTPSGPPYVIFHDKTLAAMAHHRPVTDEMFLSIGGGGAKKLERYWETFMALIRDEGAEVSEEE